MTWLAWRQQRWALVGSAVVVALYSVAATGHPPWVAQLVSATNDFGDPAYVLALGFGACWAAPLLARERQRGTIDLAYTQSVSRLRWVLARTAPVFVVAAVTTFVLVAAVRLLGKPPTTPAWAPGLIALVLLTVALGFAAGAVLGRTVRAMAATVAGFFVVMVASGVVFGWLVPVVSPDWQRESMRASLWLAVGHGMLSALLEMHRNVDDHGSATRAIVSYLPAALGVFWGAPLLARPLQDGTAELFWARRLRWLSLALATVTVVTLATAQAVRSILPSVLGGFDVRYTYDVTSTAAVGYTCFAVALGVFAGAVLGRVEPAMAATLIGYAVTRFAWGEVGFPGHEPAFFGGAAGLLVVAVFVLVLRRGAGSR
nr:ABC transporter permease subunit [Cryptosporangium phraense]